MLLNTQGKMNYLFTITYANGNWYEYYSNDKRVALNAVRLLTGEVDALRSVECLYQPNN
jgi:hypothetical protein